MSALATFLYQLDFQLDALEFFHSRDEVAELDYSRVSVSPRRRDRSKRDPAWGNHPGRTHHWLRQDRNHVEYECEGSELNYRESLPKSPDQKLELQIDWAAFHEKYHSFPNRVRRRRRVDFMLGLLAKPEQKIDAYKGLGTR